MSDTTGDTIWHYTSMEAMLQILRRRSLFFSSAAHLNDSREMAWVEELLTNPASADGTLDAISMNWLRKSVLPQDVARRSSPFVASFSMQPDKLSQWRAYANDGTGIAIGFGKERLMRNLDELYTNKGLTLFCQRVEYLSPSASSAEMYNAFRRICDENRRRLTFVGDDWPINRHANYFVKNAAFEEEEEYRICYDANARAADVSVAGPPEQYRTAHDGRLVPYVEFDLANRGSKLPITGLVLGPRNANSVQFMQQFFINLDNSLPQIETSKATYRR